VVPSCVQTLCGTFRRMCLTSVRHERGLVGSFAQVTSGMTVRSIRARPPAASRSTSPAVSAGPCPHTAPGTSHLLPTSDIDVTRRRFMTGFGEKVGPDSSVAAGGTRAGTMAA
jgi:hypothetical protein